MAKRNWRFLTNHGLVFLHLLANSDTTVRDMAGSIGLGERTVALILSELREEGYVMAIKRGRSNFYKVNSDLPMRHPLHKSHAVRDVLPLLGTLQARAV